MEKRISHELKENIIDEILIFNTNSKLIFISRSNENHLTYVIHKTHFPIANVDKT